MHAFKDNAGRTWELAIHVTAIRRVRDLAGVDLYKLVDDRLKGLGELLADPEKFVDVLFCLVKAQADATGVTDEDFGCGMAGRALGDAGEAFVGELVDFFPNPAVKAGMEKVQAKGKAVAEHLARILDETLDAIDPEAVARTLKASSGRSPGSSASTPAPSPSASST